MPTYEYLCNNCRDRFVKTMTIMEHGRKSKPVCPKCNGRKVEQLPCAFQAVTSKKA